MTERHVGFLAIGVWCGALVPIASSFVAFLLVVGVAAVGLASSRPWLFVGAAIAAASLSAGIAWSDLDASVPDTFEGRAVLVSDPVPAAGGIRVDARIDGQRYDLRAWGSAAGHLRNRLMGETVTLTAALSPLDEDAPQWLRARGLHGRGSVSAVGAFDVGRVHTRLANSIRRTLESGASSLSRDERSLFAGLVYGDDRQQSPLVADNFNAAGLTHLLAVSGQNVAFVLSIAGPVLRRLTFRPRFVFTLAVLLLFATVTRFEPSVVRASVMTSVAAVGSLVGAEVSSRRVLGIAIAGLVLLDPLIVHSVAFQLSVAASAGILLWSGRVARAIPGPRILVEAIAVTATAQIAVAPLLIWRFDGLPVASLPANVLAGPAAGPVMMWGLTGGLVAGLVPEGLAAVLHVPTRLGVWWIDGVAGLAPRASLGELGAWHIAILFGAGSFGLRQITPPRRGLAVVVIAATLLQPAIVVAARAPATSSLDGRSTLWRDQHHSVLALSSGSGPEDVLRELRRSGAGRIDLIVVDRSSFAQAQLIRWIDQRHEVGMIWAPEPTLGVGEQRPPSSTRVAVAGTVFVPVIQAGELQLMPRS